jgi:hypothetical protein
VVTGATKTVGQRLRAHLKARAEWYWAPILYLVAVGYLYREVLGGDAGFGWDTIESYWPDLVYLSDSLGKGEWPLWNPFDRGGYPYSSDPQPGLYYPVQWCFAALGILFGEAGWALIQFKMLLHHAIAGVCMHAFLRHRGLPRTAALVGGIALIASHPWLIHKASNLLMPMVWTPLIWIATDRLLASPTWRRSAALAGAIYLAGSAGSPPGFFYVLVMATLYGAFRTGETLQQHRQAKSWKAHVKRLLPALIGAALLVFALLWVGLVPALELSEHTPRVKRDLAYALSMPLPMWPTLKALVVPTAGHVDAYCGILVFMLATAALVLKPTRDRGAPIFFAIASLFFLALSFGADLPLLTWLVNHVPGFGLFRISSRYKCVFAPMFAVLAAYGAANLLQAAPRFSRDTWKVIALALTTALLALYLLYANPLDAKLVKRFPGAATSITLTLLAAGLLVSSVLHRARAAAIVVAVMPLLMIGDPERYWHHQQSFLEKKVDHKEDLQRIEALDGVLDHRFRIYDEFELEQRPGSRLQVRDFRGYPSGDPLDFQRYRDVLALASKSPELLEAYNVRYVLHGRHHRSGKRSNRLKRDPGAVSPDHFTTAAGAVRESLHPVALVQWYGGVTFAKTAQVLQAVLQSESPEGERRHVVLEESERERLDRDVLAPLEAAGAGASASVAGELLTFESDRVVVSIDAPAPGLVVLNEVSYPGWQVFVDGKAAKPLRANYLLRAVFVEAGTHRVEWRYQPPGHTVRSLAYLFGILVLFVALLSKFAWWEKLRASLAKRRAS